MDESGWRRRGLAEHLAPRALERIGCGSLLPLRDDV